jgi:hypothetical protein
MNSSNVSANGGSDGSASVNPSGGTPPYSYLWSTGGTSQNITGLSYGVYTVSVTDSKGCTINGSVVVNEPRCLGMNISVTHTNPSCFGDMNAAATATVTGGTGSFSYQWNDPLGQQTATAVNQALIQ